MPSGGVTTDCLSLVEVFLSHPRHKARSIRRLQPRTLQTRIFSCLQRGITLQRPIFQWRAFETRTRKREMADQIQRAIFCFFWENRAVFQMHPTEKLPSDPGNISLLTLGFANCPA